MTPPKGHKSSTNGLNNTEMSKMNEDFKNIQEKIINDVEGDTNKQINPVQDQEKNISKI